MFFFFMYSTRLETGLFERKRADYVYLLAFTWLVALIPAIFRDWHMDGYPLIISVLYVWCITNAGQTMPFTSYPVRALSPPSRFARER